MFYNVFYACLSGIFLDIYGALQIKINIIYYYYYSHLSVCPVSCAFLNKENKLILSCIIVANHQGFMQDKIIASHTCFGGHMDVNC